MAGNNNNNGGGGGGEKTYFEQQREMLVGDVAQNLEAVLQNMNKLNRSLEGIIAVGNEFGSVEALWSQFENVMARDSNPAAAEGQAEGDQGAEDTTVLQDDKP
ncbi:dash complex subunit dad1 [Diplodia corticola]|uniref:DASH complex subunit DAD1 n=1 Tax=Diplodia corticola TaxID=236234 RepID=A0A1J9S6W4_9PEZI|nr:dash complex subunit dad1 [Diplodia corticola]OJD40691.1 dash complex subunit dad1 [Diplodia corticola]